MAGVKERGEKCQYGCKFNFIYAYKKSMAFPVPIFMKFKFSTAVCSDPIYKVLTKSDNNRGDFGGKLIYIHKVWHSLHQFLSNSQPRIKFWTFSCPNFINIR
jgi:hypothetical protein